ncbi:ATP-binding protein [Oceanobacillus bengalensis]|uniref:Circadian input-output histidine kinase CikA n=1 Tax=Oceanobacillus bengalensis TaxID=1435466 RepID=A0A494Z7M5_9BACI|nr:ATP-binding protein [Oceanobacillus bengalensis]RKQ18537.1 response regulator [Oceanobacillus bengalensis]
MINRIKTSKWTLIIVIFLVVITGIRLIWFSFLTTLDYADSPTINDGVLDLRGHEFNNKQTFQLSGDWEFYPSKFISPNEPNDSVSPIQLDTPHKWNTAFEDDQSFTFGTYRLRIFLDAEDLHTFGLRLNKLNNASTVYVNGERVGGSGQAATTEEQHKGSSVPYTVAFNPDQNEVEILIHASSSRNNGGIVKPIRFGTVEAVHYQNLLSIGLQLILCIVLLLHSIYVFILYFMRSAVSKSLLYLTLLFISGIITVLSSDDKILFNFVSVGYDWEIKVAYLSYICVGALIPLVINQLFPNLVNQKALRYFIIYCLLYMFFMLVAPLTYVLKTVKILLVIVLIGSILTSTINFRKAKIDRDESIFLLLGCLSIGINIIWATVNSNTLIDMMHYPFDLIITLLCFTAFWFKRFFRITLESKQLAEKLQLENQRKDEFLVNTSHELRNPLHGISNITQTLLDDKTNPLKDEQKQRLSTLVNISKRMSFMLNDLLDVTRLKEKTLQLHLKRTHIQSVVAGVIDMTKLMTEGKPVQLQIHIPDTFPAVLADENRLIQILFNLIHNAIKFTDKGTITVRATIAKEMAHIHIEDTGIGIQESELNKIFDPYEQAAINAERASGGFGLGLNICKQLVELQNGTLRVQSTKGEGSVFTFTLPIYKGADDIEETNMPFVMEEINENLAATVDFITPNEEHSVKTKLKILIVDDDPINLDILRTILEREDYQIISVTSAAQAIERIEREPYDLVISDVMMPQVSGYDLTRMIRKRFSASELPVLLLTARTRTEDVLAGFKSGANDYVTKPIDSWELKARVHALTNLKVTIEERIRMEGAWLQSQIQPHFIFNTLNSIAALGQINITKMHELLEEFSHYLRLSFDFHNADPVVPLAYELSLVRSYLYIEKTRFGDRLSIEWDTDDNMEILIPPLSIQPLVENAVKHGVLQYANGGKIIIRLKEQADQIKFSIIDNGKGMTEEEMKQLFTEEHSSKRTSVGLRNVERRLKQFYGKGLIIESSPNKGTTISFYIPK